MIAGSIPYSLPEVFATISEPNIKAQDDRIKILNNGIGYSKLFSANTTVSIFPRDAVIFLEIINISDEIIFDVVIGISTYTKSSGISKDPIFCSPLKYSLLPNESTIAVCWIPYLGWSCFETWVLLYEVENVHYFGEAYSSIYQRQYTLEVKSVQDKYGMISGKIKNNSDYKINDVLVTVVKYDHENNIIGVLHDDISHISPGKSEKFAISAYLLGQKSSEERDILLYGTPSHIEIFATGWDTTSDLSYSLKDRIKTNEYNPNYMPADVFNSYYFASKFFDSNLLKSSHIDIDNISTIIADEKVCSFSKPVPTPLISTNSAVPEWIKNNAGWWAEGQIDDTSFLQGIQFLIKNGIIVLEDNEIKSEDEIQRRADWIWNQNKNPHPVKDFQLSNSLLTQYKIEDGKITSPIHSNMNESLTELVGAGIDEKLDLKIWNFIKEIIPDIYMEKLSTLMIVSDGPSKVLAGVGRDSDDQTKWIIKVDPVDAAPSGVFEGKMIKNTLIHEFAHILSLDIADSDGNIAVRNDSDLNWWQQYNELIEENEEKCFPNYYDWGTGCMNNNSYMNLFYEQFWSGIIDEFSYEYEFVHASDFGENNEYFYSVNKSLFITEYSADQPAEDFAESFTAFVLFEDPNFPKRSDYYFPVKKDKIEFFYDFPELVKIREYIRSNL